MMPKFSLFDKPLKDLKAAGFKDENHFSDVLKSDILSGIEDIIDVEFDPNYDIISKNNEVTLSVISSDIQNEVSIFPTPSSNKFKIIKPRNLTIESLAIYNTSGQNIATMKYSKYIDVRNYSAGQYFVKFYSDRGLIFKPLLIK